MARVAKAVSIIILLIVLAKLVYCVVSQVHIHVAHIFLVRKFVWCRCKSNKSIIINIYSEWINSVK